jgi:hypothetical protein
VESYISGTVGWILSVVAAGWAQRKLDDAAMEEGSESDSGAELEDGWGDWVGTGSGATAG